VGREWRRNIQRLLCRHFYEKLPNLQALFSVSQRKRNRPTKAFERMGRISFAKLGEGFLGGAHRQR